MKTAVETLKKTLESDDVEAIKKDTEELTKPLYELSAALYKQNEEQAGPTDATSSADDKKSDDNIVDAEVVDEDKKK